MDVCMEVALITGANKGIGLELVHKLLNNNFKVIALSKNVDNLEKIVDSNLKIYQVDLLEVNKVLKVLNELKKEKIYIDVLINNAGIGLFKKIEEYTIKEWNDIIQVNLIIPFILINQLLPCMKEKGHGRIINIGSDADTVPFSEAGAYCASKYGLRGMTECIRLDLKKSNINITTISPGRVDTYFNGKFPGCRPNALQASDIANQVLFVLVQDPRCNIDQIKLTSSCE